jgi:putrescine aminotransferase
MGVSGVLADKGAFAPLLPGLAPVPAPDPACCPPGMPYADYAEWCADALEEHIERAPGSVAAFIMEPVLGSAGVVIPPPEYFRRITRACRLHGVLMLVDEVATGFGRTGRWFASEHFGLRPDMMLLAKGINSGYLPLGAVLFSAKIGDALLRNHAAIGHGSSHNGNPACCAAALATIEVIRSEGLVARAEEMGHYFRRRLDELGHYPWVWEVRSLGLMLGLGLIQDDGSPASPHQVAVLSELMQRVGVLLYPGPSSLVFLPALVITRDEVDAVVDRLHAVLSAVRLTGGAVLGSEGP